MTTDAEVIARFMEPPPTLGGAGGAGRSGGGWWFWDRHLEWPTVGGVARWVPMFLTLDRLHLVEARLSEEQWTRYIVTIAKSGDNFARDLLHASAKQKITALATVLRASTTDRLRNMTGDQAEAAGRADWERVTGGERG